MSLFLLIILSVLQTGSSQGKHLFVQTGSQVTLDIPYAPEDDEFLSWTFNDVVLVNSDRYSSKAECRKCVFHRQNGSLTLQNLQKEDGGLYTASVDKKSEDHISLIHYKFLVKVLDSVVKDLTTDLTTTTYVQQVSAEVPGVSKQKVILEINQDLQLEFPESYRGGNTLVLWKYNGYNIIRSFGNRTTINADYKDRVDFSPLNLTLIVKNVQVNDSGIYSSRVCSAVNKANDPVSPVELSVSSVSSSSESCNFTVSCTTELYNISRSFTCDTHNCEEQTPQTYGHANFGYSSLHLYLSNQSIICNHSNHISWTTDTKDTLQRCIRSETGPEEVLGWSVCMMKTLVYCVGLLLMLSALITVHVLEHRTKQD
ncbi:uncharacterized protein LOC129408369 [Boleophthalmus pectinirostris]|uniref:uncharacterized protein LOC129408369 n=1 Tax=Boleophthalmus pectinirostris TaxID=150288 RepID=UPI00242ECFEE|nr:uncharacterized protein LOC129408369 [Boleophthalmus pectinirostris]